MNLVVNAWDAMPDRGILVLETSSLLAEEDLVQTHLAARPGAHVTLTVSDTGTGMSAETKAHLLEPFFTTKEPGKGTGLGLATVYGIVRQSGGAILVDSEPGKGAAFQILFPAVAAQPENDSAPAAPGVLAGKETILVVEDEPGLRDFIRRVLVKQGYTVLQAPNGVEALALARAHSAPIDLLLTDVVMPKMSGVELAEKFVAEHPAVRVMFMSGYTDRLGVTVRAPANYLQKPFTSAVLLTRLRAELTGKQYGSFAG